VDRTTATLRTLDVRHLREWRAWLARHQAASPGVWLVFHKQHTGEPSISYEASVREALCVGWIDSLIKRLDDDRYARKFTPRTPASRWSDLNRTRWAELKVAGRLTPAGLAAAPTGRTYAPMPTITELPSDAAAAFRANRKAWAFFEQLAPSYRRYFALWIDSARRPETREKRIRGSIALLAAGKKLGLK
jgi:uncharacterized protein YdeI (YjbR/CyaY-like superfamily)